MRCCRLLPLHALPCCAYRLPYWSDDFPRWETGTLRDRVVLLDPVGYDLLEQLLIVSPSERRAARFLLNHPWFDDVRSQLTQFVPWYRGLEHQYARMAAINRLPLPKTIRALTVEKQRQKCLTAPPDESSCTSSDRCTATTVLSCEAVVQDTSAESLLKKITPTIEVCLLKKKKATFVLFLSSRHRKFACSVTTPCMFFRKLKFQFTLQQFRPPVRKDYHI